MPKIPEYFATEQMETSRLPRAPAGQLADTGQGLKAESLAGIGGALGKVGQVLANIEVEKQRARNNVTLAQMKGLLDDFEYVSRPDPAQFEKIEDFKKAEEQYGENWKKKSDEISRSKNRQITDQFKVYTELHWDVARKDYHNKSWSLEQDYALAQFNNLWSEKFRNFISKPEQLKTELSGLIEQFEAYLKPTQKQRFEASIDEEIAKYQKTLIDLAERQRKEKLKIAIEKDVSEIFDLISAGQSAENYINNSPNLDGDTKWKWRQREQAEFTRLAKGEEIVTDNEVRSNLYTSIFQVFSGAKTHKEALDEAKESRMPGIDKDGKPTAPTLDQEDYETFEIAINANYKESYKYQMGKVNKIADGLLLNPDSLGYIKNAPIRYKVLGEFQKAWLKWIEDETAKDRIKISDIYPEGMRLAAIHQISDEEAERQEIVMNEDLAAREARKKAAGAAAGRAAVEAIKRVKAVAEIREFLGPVNTMNKPASLKEFEESMAQLPTRDARQRYYRKWYNEVKSK